MLLQLVTSTKLMYKTSKHVLRHADSDRERVLGGVLGEDAACLRLSRPRDQAITSSTSQEHNGCGIKTRNPNPLMPRFTDLPGHHLDHTTDPSSTVTPTRCSFRPSNFSRRSPMGSKSKTCRKHDSLLCPDPERNVGVKKRAQGSPGFSVDIPQAPASHPSIPHH